MDLAKGDGIAVILVGHVTKDGSIAGPKTLEHLVDAVVNLEGERYAALRLVRATKNRFGSTDEVGVFEMAETGLLEVADPARAFLGRSRAGGARQHRRPDARGQPAAPRRGPGPRQPDRLRDAVPQGQRPRSEPAQPADRCARTAGGDRPRQPRRLREPGRRAVGRRACARPAGRPRPCLIVARPADPAGNGRDRRGRAARRAARRRRPGTPPAGGGSTRVRAGDRAASVGRGRPRRDPGTRGDPGRHAARGDRGRPGRPRRPLVARQSPRC